MSPAAAGERQFAPDPAEAPPRPVGRVRRRCPQRLWGNAETRSPRARAGRRPQRGRRGFQQSGGEGAAGDVNGRSAGRRAPAMDRSSVARVGGGGGGDGGFGVGGSEGQKGLGGLDGLHPRAALRPVRRLRRAAPAGSDEGGGGPERGRASQRGTGGAHLAWGAGRGTGGDARPRLRRRARAGRLRLCRRARRAGRPNPAQEKHDKNPACHCHYHILAIIIVIIIVICHYYRRYRCHYPCHYQRGAGGQKSGTRHRSRSAP